MTDDPYFTGQLLIAMPSMSDPRFARTVIYLCAHSEEGAMGLVINKPVLDIKAGDMFSQLDIEPTPETEALPVMFGGPVEQSRGFVLHSPEYQSSLKSLTLGASFAMTSTMDILEDIASGQGPERSLIMLGYAGWGPAQLEGEITHNGWLTCPATPELVFELESDAKWAAALRSIGVDALGLSGVAGRA